MSMESERVRALFAQGDAKRDAGLTTPPDVTRYDDIVYGEDAVWQALDVYRPREAAGRTLPVIVSVHGGAWVYGSKEVYQFYCMSLAQRGFAVVNFSYRLAPEHPHPAQLQDIGLTLQWALANANAYGLDTRNVFAVGDSAGAHLLALYCALCANPKRAAAWDVATPLLPRAVALNCGKYRMQGDGPDDTTVGLMADFLPGGGAEWELREIDVPSQVTDTFPPAFLMTANNDFLKAQSPLLARALLENGVPFALRVCGDANEPLGHVFHCDMRSAAAVRINDAECAFFREFLV